MAGQSPLRGCSTVWSKAKKNYELEWRSLRSTQESAWLCKLLFILTKTPLRQQLLCLPPLDGVFFVSGCVACPEPFPVTRCPIRSGCATEGWWCANLAVPKHTQSRCQKRDYLKGSSTTKAGQNAFLIPATFPCDGVRLWPMTRDRCSQLMRSDAASGGR